MKDPITNESITVSIDGTAGPYIIINNSLTERVVDLLGKRKILLSIDEGAMTTGSGTICDVINLHGDIAPDDVQKLLDIED